MKIIFQPVCKTACQHYYAQENFYEGWQPEFGSTWTPSSVYPGGLEFGLIRARGKTLQQSCPSEWQEEWTAIQAKITAYQKALTIGLVEMEGRCLLDVIPTKDLKRYLDLKNSITQAVLTKDITVTDESIRTEIYLMLLGISHRALNLKLENLKPHLHRVPVRELWKRLLTTPPHINFDMFKTKTGRLATRRGSFPILTLPKEHRNIIIPTNDYFVELDYNSAELRTLLALGSGAQPAEDLHQWNATHVYGDTCTREEAKKRIFAWLYNPESKDYLSGRAYDRDEALHRYYDGHQITNPFGRTIPADKKHALNYLIQSTTSDMFLRQTLKIHQYIEKHMEKSFISFTVHDSLVLDIHADEAHHVPSLAKLFRETPFGEFLINAKGGTNYGELEEIK